PRGGGPPLRQERQEALAAVGWRAVAHGARVPLRGLQGPPVTLLRDGRGGGGAGRREPPPLPGARGGVPRARAAPDRQPPEADDGVGRHAVRRVDAARWF